MQKVGPPAAAVFPGVLLHGAGHWAAGDASTGRTLFLLEGAGLGSTLGGIIVLAASGASKRLVAPAAVMMIGGAGLFITTWLADVYGSATGGARGEDVATGAPLTEIPAVETSLGYRYVYDPTFAYRSFVTTSLDVRFGPLRLRPEGWFSTSHANERLRLLGAYRLSGPRPLSLDGRSVATPPVDGSFVDVETSVTRHAYPPERFTISSLEVGFAGRLDLRRMARSLRGSFVDAGLGYGVANNTYALEGAPSEVTDQLLARFGFGLYLGHPRPGGVYGETSIFYDHRHDGYAGGLKMSGLGSGVPGSFGARGLVWLGDDFGVSADAQAGSAAVLGLSIIVRQRATGVRP